MRHGGISLAVDGLLRQAPKLGRTAQRLKVLVDEMEWTPLTEGERETLSRELHLANSKVAVEPEDLRWWSYRAQLIELILEYSGEEQSQTPLGERVALVGGLLLTSDLQRFGMPGGIRGAERDRALDGLPGALVKGLQQFHANRSSAPARDPFNGAPSKRNPFRPKKSASTD